MRIEGERRFDASREAVFAALTDPALMSSAMPGVRDWDASDPDRWTIAIGLPLPLAPTLRIAVEVLERQEPAHARLRAAGSGLGGGARVESRFDLEEPAEEETLMRWTADFELSGPLGALVGGGMLESMAKRQAERTLDAIAARVEPGDEDADES
jgi:carbon monoxide dehydrogenase subunit G